MPDNHSHPAFSHQIKGLLLMIGSLFLFIAWFTFSKTPGHNWLGLVGNTTAYIFRFFFGLCTLPLLVLTSYRGYQIFKRGEDEPHKHPIVLISIIITSLGILLNLSAEIWPEKVKSLSPFVHVETNSQKRDFFVKKTRYNLGGVPLYYLYKDLPLINLQRLLSDVGTGLVSGTSLFIALFLMLYPEIKRRREEKATQPSLSTPTLKEKGRSLKSMLTTKIRSMKQSRFDGKDISSKVKTIPKAPKKTTVKHYNPPEEEVVEAPKLERNESVFDKLKKSKPTKKLKLPSKGYKLPSPDLLTSSKQMDPKKLEQEIKQQAEILEETLLSFGIEGKVGQIHVGPRIISFEVHPAAGVKVQKIKTLENDIALNLQAKSLRIIAPIPGKAAVGIEVPTKFPQEVNFKQMILDYQRSKEAFHVPVILGKTVSGESITFDLTKMPHMIIAGATGSGKSVCINTIIMSILMQATPDEIKMLMIDPKKVELTPYTDLPHMISPVITEPHQAAQALRWLVVEMERRYEILKRLGLRHVSAFNQRERDKSFEESSNIEIPEKLPYIVAIIDELADLMMTSPADIETPIARIAQMARAVGIHLILATQRPSREVITGLIKANFPSRISFKVSSKINSQIILDEVGAESLLGNGDMLFLHPSKGSLLRTQGVFTRDEDIARVIEHWQREAPPNYMMRSENLAFEDATKGAKSEDSLFDEACRIVIETNTASTTFLQRKLRIGYARAASLMDELEAQGIVAPPEGSGKPRRVLVQSSSDSEQEPLGSSS